MILYDALIECHLAQKKYKEALSLLTQGTEGLQYDKNQRRYAMGSVTALFK